MAKYQKGTDQICDYYYAIGRKIGQLVTDCKFADKAAAWKHLESFGINRPGQSKPKTAPAPVPVAPSAPVATAPAVAPAPVAPVPVAPVAPVVEPDPAPGPQAADLFAQFQAFMTSQGMTAPVAPAPVAPVATAPVAPIPVSAPVPNSIGSHTIGATVKRAANDQNKRKFHLLDTGIPLPKGGKNVEFYIPRDLFPQLNDGASVSVSFSVSA